MPPAPPSSPPSIHAAECWRRRRTRRATNRWSGCWRSEALTFLLGEGRDPSGQWTAETECIVFGISLAEGLEIARRFEQNAVVFIERGKAPRLEFPEE